MGSPRDPRAPRDTVVRRNTVVENNRPDVGARAGLLVVANQQGASATILDAATLKTVATVPVKVTCCPDRLLSFTSTYMLASMFLLPCAPGPPVPQS